MTVASSLEAPAFDQRFSWPLAFDEVAAVLEDKARHHLEFAASLSDFAERTTVLGGVLLLNATQVLIETALTLQAAERQGVRLAHISELSRYLAGEIDWRDLPSEITRQLLSRRNVQSFGRLREIKQAATWNTWRAPVALFNPAVTAITTNALVKQAACDTSRPIAFQSAWSIFSRGDTVAGPSPYDIDHEALAAQVTDVMCDIPCLDDPWRSRLRDLINREAKFLYRQVAEDLARLSNTSICDEIWSGSGGFYPSRLIGLEVMRRGGHVKRMAHGATPSVMLRRHKAVQSVEFSVSSEYVTVTEDFSTLMAELGATSSMPAIFRPKISHMSGDPVFKVPARFRRPASRHRPRVLYAPTPRRGFRQYQNPQLPDLVYLDWQFRLVEHLQQLNLDLIYSLHPLERRGDRNHPISGIAEISDLGFENLIEETDIVVLDYFRSTTFATAVCSRIPVILINADRSDFEPQARKLIEERCVLIDGLFDDRGRPTIDFEILDEAISKAPKEVDPSFFRRLYAGAS